MLPLRARVELGAMAMKGCSVFPKAPAPRPQDTHCGVLPLCRGTVSVLYSPSRLGKWNYWFIAKRRYKRKGAYECESMHVIKNIHDRFYQIAKQCPLFMFGCNRYFDWGNDTKALIIWKAYFQTDEKLCPSIKACRRKDINRHAFFFFFSRYYGNYLYRNLVNSYFREGQIIQQCHWQIILNKLFYHISSSCHATSTDFPLVPIIHCSQHVFHATSSISAGLL